MRRARAIEAELDALRAELLGATGRPAQSAPGAPKPAPQAETVQPDEMRDKLGELAQAMTDYLESAEDMAADHPFAVAGAAFLLGVGVGMLLKRG